MVQRRILDCFLSDAASEALSASAGASVGAAGSADGRGAQAALPRADGNRDPASGDPFAKMLEFQSVQMRMLQEQTQAQLMMFSSMMAAQQQSQSKLAW